jgi:hypothetical protein
MRTIDEKSTVYQVFDSVDELLDFAERVPESRMGANVCYCDVSFTGRNLHNWAGVKRANRSAWADGLEVLERMLRDLDEAPIDRPKSRRRRTRFNEDNGDEVDYDRLRSGQPFWRTSRREFARGPATVTVLVDVGANCNVNHEDILWRGAAAIALAKRLEAAGYRVELWSICLSEYLWARGRSMDTAVMNAVCLKRPSDPLDESTLISAVSGWFFRTAHFRAWCSGSHRVHRALGHHRGPKPGELDHVSRDQNRIVIKGAFSYEAAVAKVREAIVNLKTH